MEGAWGTASMSIAIVALTTLVLIRLAWQRWRCNDKAIKWPPGPPTMPIIGNLHQLSKEGDLIHVALTKLAQVHGRVMTVWFGSSKPMVVVTDHELAWEVLVSKSSDYAARKLPMLEGPLSADFRTIISSNAGPYWHTLRRGLQQTGLGPLSVSSQWSFQESDMAEMIQNMKDEASRNGGLVKPYPHIFRSNMRLLARLCFGPQFSDENFNQVMIELIEDAMSSGDVARLVDSFPIARFVPSVKRTIMNLYEAKQRILKLIKPHLVSPPPQNSYAHYLLSQGYPEDVVVFSIFEVFYLGVDSTGSTVLWAIAFLVSNQEAQQKLYREIKELGSKNEKGIVKVEEVGKLQYLQAVVKETMRMKPIAPILPHTTARDTVLNGTRLPKDATVTVNTYALHYDPKVWEEPKQFMPERFLESTKQVQSKKGVADQSSFLPFGAGMRSCAGMEVGKLQLGFMVANLVNAFHWTTSLEGKNPDLTETFTFVVTMKTPLEARIVPRAT